MALLRGITTEQRRNVIDELDQRWCAHAFDSMQRAAEAAAAGKSFDARNWTWAAGVATDKVFAIREIPTQVVANLHEHRIHLPEIMDKLAAASRVLSVHQRKGFQQVSALPSLPSPATRSHPVKTETIL